MKELWSNEMKASKITFKGQVTIPKRVRIALGVQAGDLVIFSVEGEQAVLKPFIKKSLVDFYGILPATRKYPGSEAIRRELHQKISNKIFERIEK
jgi:AbrB family looped-hinge helix DNA binding protein